MREIEFRGKAIHPNSLEQIVGSWAYGGIFENKIISRNLDMDSHYHGFISEIEIDLKTIGQYTGLKDKNGKKIFEGDIVDISVYDRLDWSSIKGKVVFLNGAWLVEDVGHFAITLQSETNEIEIIGNVHENLGLREA
ncbi:TPA: hypothetical protein H9267_002725 [Listeria monocytogenes]|nr:hypothetical protein [Listeria monocytogenes]HAM1166903.1 hypothetical protein [Listeria monocytogenes]